MRSQWMIYLGAALLAGAAGSALLGPAPANAVNRDMVELQQNMMQLMQSQQALQSSITQNDAVERTLLAQTNDSVNKLGATLNGINGTVSNLEKSLQDLQATSGARLDSMSTQVQGVSDNLQEALARMGKLNQQLTDAQNAIQAIDAKISSASPAAAPLAAPAALGGAPGGPGTSAPGLAPNSAPNSAPYPAANSAANSPAYPAAAAPVAAPPVAPAAAPPSADLLYSNGLRDLNGRKYELATQEFRDYLKYYSDTDLASNAQFYLGEIAYQQKQYQEALEDYTVVIERYPRSFKLAPAHLRRGLALLALNQKASGVKELQTVVKQYPGTDEERQARAKLRELGVA